MSGAILRNGYARAVAFSMAWLACGGLAAATLNTVPFGKKMSVTFSGYDGASTLPSFPALVRLSATEANKFSYADCQSDGSDIRFADADGNAIPHEIDTWDPEGESLIWVRVPALAGTTTSVTMYYKANPSVLEVVMASDVWSGYVAVYHCAEKQTDLGTFEPDATSNKLDAQIPASVVGKLIANNRSGMVGSGFAMTGRECYAKVPASETLATLNATVTASGWMKLDKNAATWGAAWTSKNDDLWHKSNEGVAVVFDGSLSKLHARGYQNQNAGATLDFSLLDSWHFVSCVYDNTDYYLYVDGVQVSHGENKTPVKGSSSYPLLLGGRTNNYGSYQMCGVFDEFRFKASADSADWVNAEYDAIDKADFAVLGEATEVSHGSELSVSLLKAEYKDDGSVAVSGQLVALGGADSAVIDLEYGETEELGDSVRYGEPLTAVGEFAVSIPDATPGVTYYLRLKATTSKGVAYSAMTTFAVPAATVLSQAVSASSENALATYAGFVVTKGRGVTTVSLYLGADADHLEPVATTEVTGSGDFAIAHLTPPDTIWCYAFKAQDDDDGTIKDSNWSDVGQVKVTDGSGYLWVGGAEGELTQSANWQKDTETGYGYPSKGSLVNFASGAQVTILVGKTTGVKTLAVNNDDLKLTVRGTVPSVAMTFDMPAVTARNVELTFDAVKSTPSALKIGGASNTVSVINGADVSAASLEVSGQDVAIRAVGEGSVLTVSSASFSGARTKLILDNGAFGCLNLTQISGEDFFLRFAGKKSEWFSRSGIVLDKAAIFEYSIPEGGYDDVRRFYGVSGRGIVGGNGNSPFVPKASLTVRLAADAPIRSVGKAGAGTYELINFHNYIANGNYIANTNNFVLEESKGGTGEFVWTTGLASSGEERPGILSLKYSPPRPGLMLIVK